MRKKYKRLKLLELTEVQALETVLDLFKKDYNKEISYLADETIPIRDKMLLNKWRQRENDFSILTFERNDVCIRYLKVNAYLEIAAPANDAVIDGMVLPRSNRVKSYEYPVLFFEKNDKVYCILRCAEYMDSKIKSNLMGAGRAKAELSEAWGKIADCEIEQYSFSSNLFYWLIKKDSQDLEYEKEGLRINSIKTLDNSSLRGDTNYSSEGDDLLSEAVIKTTLGIDVNVDSVGMTIEQDDGTFDIMIDTNGTCGIDDSASILIREGGQVDFIDNYFDEVVIRIYCYILPVFKKLYKDESESGEWNKDTLQICKKTWALEVINDLCYDNEIEIEDVLKLECFNGIDS
ncbi:hypothetical protein [Clostridium tertium]|uniref:hypothetical protein n=1 Tax=Clostridium tertium TaxID=1559 RepID=UPI000C07D13D|nr:hypothetical protein [Clostridium tertium]